MTFGVSRLGWLFWICFSGPLQAETRDEFVARVTAAWATEQPAAILALYERIEEREPDHAEHLRRELAAWFKSCRLKAAYILPLSDQDFSPEIDGDTIAYLLPEVDEVLCEEIYNEEAKGSFWRVSPVCQDEDGWFWLTTPERKRLEWAGPKPKTYQIRLSPNQVPKVMMVTEVCGHTGWYRRGNFGTVTASRLIQIVVQPLPDLSELRIEVSRDGEKPFFSKTLDPSRGALVPIEPP